MNALNWLKPSANENKANENESTSSFLITGGAEIWARTSFAAAPIHIESGSCLAITGEDAFRKNFLCDWLLGFKDLEGASIEFRLGSEAFEAPERRKQYSAILGRSPLMYGETIQEAILYRTQAVRKDALYYFMERLYGLSLKARTNPQNPLLDKNNKPIPTQILSAREHLEIAQINVMLQKTALVVLDFSSPFMRKAFAEGFRPARELFESGKTILVILPETETIQWAEDVMGLRFTGTLKV
ncbi:MAG: hypothetical protein HYW49_08345 [Deltaproteobacteria bacterium]|nr:hypothetical protein [Deltaproteobacteria bacterium]